MRQTPTRHSPSSRHSIAVQAFAFITSIVLSCITINVLAEETDKPVKVEASAKDESKDRPKIAMKARATIVTCGESPERIGRAQLREIESSEGIKNVIVTLGVRNMSPGKHAVHIHETAKCDPCGAAGGHFDPGPHGHTNPDGNHPFHAGDLVNLEVKEDGTGRLRTQTSRITLSEGPLSIFDEDGSAFIVHVDPDTYCPEGVTKGCAGGARAACGIIEKM